jgi:phage gp45-like
MAGSPKQKLEHAEETDEATSEQREVYLKDGRKLTLSEQGGDQLVEIRNESGLVEVRIKLTEEGPVLQMEAVRMQLKAAEQVEIHSARVEINGTEQVSVTGGKIEVEGEEDVTVDAKGEVRVTGKMIYLN